MYVTPCVQLCSVDKDTNKCKGCGRTLDQIRNWSRYTDEQRMEVMKELGYGTRTSKKDRMAKMATRRTGAVSRRD